MRRFPRLRYDVVRDSELPRLYVARLLHVDDHLPSGQNRLAIGVHATTPYRALGLAYRQLRPLLLCAYRGHQLDSDQMLGLRACAVCYPKK